MVHACIIASANMYEEPRPPRRGSHRPAPIGYSPLNHWSETRHGYGYASDGYALPRNDLDGSADPLAATDTSVQGSTAYYRPQDDELWKPSSLLPARRSVPPSKMMTGRHRVSTHMGHPSRANEQGFPARYQSPDRSEPLPSAFTLTETVDMKAQSPLELVRQLHGRVPDRDALEQSILESYARSVPQSAACQSAQKRCMYPGCSKISVSRGLCRGHGGGRRCHVPGCTKSAQSRSNFCWAHGGGQRCDVEQCMRSRKSKHFCMAHMHLEGGTESGTSSSPDSSTSTSADHRTTACRADSSSSTKTSVSRAASPTVRALPSLGQALSSASRSAPNLPARSAKQFISV